MTCEELKEMFELYALGVLEGEEKEQIEAHLARGCGACEKSHREALAVNSLLLSMVTTEAPPRRLRRRVLAGVGVERGGWGWLGALAAVGMVVVAAWLGMQERQRAAELVSARNTILEVSAQRQQLEQALSFLNQPETQQLSFGKGQPTPPRGNVLINVRMGVLLIASNLPPLGAGKTYEMWILPKRGGAPRPAGLFQANAQSTAMHVLSGPIDTSTLQGVAVTVEPEAGSSAPTTDPVLVAEAAGL